MITITITPEQREAIEQAGSEPVRLEIPESHTTYVLITEERYRQLRPWDEAQRALRLAIPEGIRRSQDAFFRDLPKLLEDENLRGKWVCYHGDEQLGVAPKMDTLIRECLRRGLKRDQYDLFVIEPQSREIEEMEIVTWEV